MHSLIKFTVIFFSAEHNQYEKFTQKQESHDTNCLMNYPSMVKEAFMDIMYKMKTNKSFEQAVEDLKTSLGEHKFGVLWEMNFKDKLQEKGLDFNTNFKVLEACNPPKAKKVLDAHLEAGFFLPCKMVVYENEGTVMLGMLRPTELMGLTHFNDLSEIAREVEDALKSAIDEAV